MRKTLAIPLLVLSFLLVVGVGSITARTLDKAGPKLANQVKEALSEVGILDDNRVILLTPSKNITSGSTKEVAWAIPSEKYSVEGRCVKNQLPTPLLKEVEAVGGVMNQSTNCKNVKTVIY